MIADRAVNSNNVAAATTENIIKAKIGNIGVRQVPEIITFCKTLLLFNAITEHVEKSSAVPNPSAKAIHALKESM
tara:strand:- start:41 stop:265 length:225 start_codon:yes stop_codon:yes gene_type:complete